MSKAVEMFNVAVLDYTPLYVRGYKEHVTKEMLRLALREAMPEEYMLGLDYVRGLKYDIPDKKYDMVLIAGSVLSAAYPSEELDRALEQIDSVIWDIPTMGICFGLHAIAKLAGSESEMINEFEIGPKEVALYSDIAGVGKLGEIVLLPVNHSFKINNADKRLMVLGISNGGIQIADASEHFWGNPVFGVQAHPELAVTRQGWSLFRKIYEDTIREIVSGEYQGMSLNPILNALGKEQYDRFMESVNDNPNAVIGVGLSREQTDLLMSPFHNIDHRQRLFGKKQSERNYSELREKSRGLIANFLHRAIRKKNMKKPKPEPVHKKEKIKKGTQLKLKIG